MLRMRRPEKASQLQLQPLPADWRPLPQTQARRAALAALAAVFVAVLLVFAQPWVAAEASPCPWLQADEVDTLSMGCGDAVGCGCGWLLQFLGSLDSFFVPFRTPLIVQHEWSVGTGRGNGENNKEEMTATLRHDDATPRHAAAGPCCGLRTD